MDLKILSADIRKCLLVRLRTIQPMEYMGTSYFSLKNQVIKAERRILKELGFCVHVKHPHKVIIMYLNILESQTNTPLAQKAWNYMNDSFRTNIFVRYPPETIGCACIFLSARQLEISLPTRPPWWELFGAKLEELEEISLTLLSLYTRPKANLDTLQKAVSEIRNELAQKKSESQADGAPAANNSTPNLSPTEGITAARDGARQGLGSRPSSPNRVSPLSVSSLTDGKKKSSSKVDEDKRTSHKERPISRASRRSRSPINRRSRSRSGSRTRSRSRSRSKSYSLSISPDNISRSESESSDESPDKQKRKYKRRRSPARGRDDEKRTRPRKYDGDYVRKKARSDGFNRHQREKTRERSRSPLSESRSRSRSRSPTKRPRGKYEPGREKKKREDRHRDRNGVDYRTSRNKGRDHRHRR